jgi:hypothetical protein
MTEKLRLVLAAATIPMAYGAPPPTKGLEFDHAVRYSCVA